MSDDILFQIKEESLDTGLRGVPVGHCPTSQVDPQKGLTYRGYPIMSLAYKDPEEVIYLLLHSHLPNANELKSFKEKLVGLVGLHDGVFEHIKSLPKKTHPMKCFISSLNAMGMYHAKGNYEEDGLFAIANLPSMVAALFRVHLGWGDVIGSKASLGYIENFVHLLKPPKENKNLIDLLRVFEILHFDHGGGNLSTFVGKAIASAQADIYESLIGAMAGLAGPLHGKANQECLLFLKEALGVIKDPNDKDKIQNFLEDIWAQGKKIYGFGHAVLRVEDPRATIQYQLGEKIASNDPIYILAKNLRKIASVFLSKQKKVSNPYPNVDAVSGSLLNACGLTNSSYYTVFFGMSRCVGIIIQIIYERTIARQGKGTPIVRPKYLYNGPSLK